MIWSNSRSNYSFCVSGDLPDTLICGQLIGTSPPKPGQKTGTWTLVHGLKTEIMTLKCGLRIGTCSLRAIYGPEPSPLNANKVPKPSQAKKAGQEHKHSIRTTHRHEFCK